MQYRHGDVMLERIDALPEQVRRLPHCVLAHGEVTGHSHRIQDHGTAVLYQTPDTLMLEVEAESADLVHEEHATIRLPRGLYRVWRQREYSPESIRIIRD
ncbi:MAG: hypothetical protein AAF533_12725 [Acidobacteriota bacterium]